MTTFVEPKAALSQIEDAPVFNKDIPDVSETSAFGVFVFGKYEKLERDYKNPAEFVNLYITTDEIVYGRVETTTTRFSLSINSKLVEFFLSIAKGTDVTLRTSVPEVRESKGDNKWRYLAWRVVSADVTPADAFHEDN